MQSGCRDAGSYLLQGFQQLPQGNDGDHHNPSRDDTGDLKDTHPPSTGLIPLPHASQLAGCVRESPVMSALGIGLAPPCCSVLLRETRIIS